MKITIKNLGALKQASFSLGELTIICGGNNTGKTYATYALFGFLTFWRNAFSIKVHDSDVQQLLNDGVTELDIQDYIKNAKEILEEGCKAYTEELAHVFASSEKHFINSEFWVDLEQNDIHPSPTFERTMGAAKTQLFSITKRADSPMVNISLLVYR